MMEKSKVKSILPKPSPLLNSPIAGHMSGTPTPPPKRKSLPNDSNNSKRPRSKSAINTDNDMGSHERLSKNTGHRPVTSCTFCRQHKIKCNASENYPNPCQRCEKMDLKCEIDPQFRPKKGSQIQSLKSDVDDLKAKIEMLTQNESLLTRALSQHNVNFLQQNGSANSSPSHYLGAQNSTPNFSPSNNSPVPLQMDQIFPTNPQINHLNDSYPSNTSQNPHIMNILQENSDNSPTSSEQHIYKDEIEYKHMSEFVLGEVSLPLDKANELHDKFMKVHLQFLPIIESRSATSLYHKSQLLFWTVISTAALSEPEPTLYMSLASLIKQLAIETCWIRTPRSTHVIQALIILSIWPLPNEKVLDDCSYRFVGLAKNLSLQLGLHRGGEFIQEFTRTQVSLGPDAECWRTRSWLAVFFCEQFWSSVLGLPPSIATTDYLIENARVDQSLPKNFRCLISLSIFQCKLINVMGISVTRPDGLLEPLNRAASLSILDRELERLKFKLNIEDNSYVEIYYLYVKLMICCFAFLPGTPIEDQVKYVSMAYVAATRVVTITSKLVTTIQLIELPIYIRQAMTYSVLLLFKLHLSRYFIGKYIDSARQLIVTAHRMIRNTLSSWKDLQNDISRTAKVLENLNIVLYNYPEIFMEDDSEDGGSIITRMRSHLTASLFYDLVWCVHEAKRRALLVKSNGNNENKSSAVSTEEQKAPNPFGNTRKPAPLPFYNQITKDDFKTITTTTPSGTTITTLVPTDEAMNQARLTAAELNKPLEINGIPLEMLEATGSTKEVMKVKQPVDVKEEEISSLLNEIPNELYPPIISQTFESMSNQPMYISDVNQDPFSIEQQGLPYPNNSNSQFNGVSDQMNNFLQQQSNGWLNNESYQSDDFLGWFDVNMIPEN